MSEHQHARSDEEFTPHNRREDTATEQTIKLAMTFIDRIGFPIVAFMLMFYLCYVTINRNTEALNNMVSMMKTHDVLFAQIQQRLNQGK